MSITRDQLQARAEAIADQLPSTTTTFVTAAQAVDMVNDGIRGLYDDVIDVNPDFRVTEGTVYSIVDTASNFIPLPADFRSVRAVIADPGTPYRDPLRRAQMRSAIQTEFRRFYRLQGNLVYIEPQERSLGNYQLLYSPLPPTLANGTDTLDMELEQFQDCVFLHAAVMMLTKNEWDISSVGAQLAVAKQRAQRWARNARTSDPPMVEDVRSPPRRWPRLAGTTSTSAPSGVVVTTATNIAGLQAIDVTNITAAICLVIASNRMYYLVPNTGSADDSGTTANQVDALGGLGRQWRGQ